MKKIILIILCVMLSLSLPALAASEQAAGLSTQPNSLEQVTQRVYDISTDLKLQQQKLDFLKERLELQDKRIGDLNISLNASVDFYGILITVIGILMTVVVVYFSFRSTREAVQEAKDEARKEIKAEANKIIEDELNPLIKNALNQIHEQANEELKKLEEERVKASRINDEGSQLNEKYKDKINEVTEMLGFLVGGDKPVNMKQRKKAEEAEKILESRPSKEYRFVDWIMLGFRAFESKKYEVALDHFNKAATLSSGPIEQAFVLVNKGITLGQMGKNAEEIAIYDEVVQRFGEATEAPLRELVAKTLVNKGVTLGQMGKNAEKIAVYDEVVRRFGEATEAPLREQVAAALVNKGITLGQMEKNAEEIAVYDEVVQRFGEATEAPLREQAAAALVDKGITLGQMGKNAEEIAVYDEVVQRFGEATEAPLREQVAKALMYKGVTLGQMGKNAEAIAICDEVVRRFGEATEAPLRKQVEKARRIKNNML